MTTATKLTFSRFIDLLLAAVYEADAEADGDYIDLNAIARQIKDPFPETWVIDAAKVLQSRGLLDCVFTFGSVHARLTGEGRLFIEEDRGTGIIREYKQNPERFIQNVSISGSNNRVMLGQARGDVTQEQQLEQERRPAFALVDEIKRKVTSDPSLSDREKEELVGDVESIRVQLLKREPSLPVLSALLAPLSKLTSIGSNVASLIRLING